MLVLMFAVVCYQLGQAGGFAIERTVPEETGKSRRLLRTVFAAKAVGENDDTSGRRMEPRSSAEVGNRQRFLYAGALFGCCLGVSQTGTTSRGPSERILRYLELVFATLTSFDFLKGPRRRLTTIRYLSTPILLAVNSEIFVVSSLATLSTNSTQAVCCFGMVRSPGVW